MHIDHDFRQIEQDLDGLLGPGRHRRLPWKASEIRRLRLLAGLTQAQLSELTGIMQPKISEAERGLASSKGRKEKKESGVAPRMETRLLYALAKVLGCELRDIAEVPDFAKPVTGISSDVIRQLQSQLLTVDQIHTLVRPGEKTSLRAIYYRTALIDRASGGANQSPANSAFQADTLHDIPAKASVILGTAGQGKSMFLRQLAVQETLKEQSLAIFLELRRWPSLPLADVIHKKLKNWQLCETQQQMQDLLAGGHVSLLFDAVDELDPDRRGQFLAELADLHASHPTLKIVVTSRPDSGILTCDWLHPYAIAPLALSDVRALVRIYATPAEAEQIMVQLDQLNRNLRELLTTPIFVALLIIKFRYSQTLPTDMTAFYRDLFDALVRRHNMAESGLRRKLKSGLLPFDLETVFQQICLAIHQQFGDQSPHLRQVQDIAGQIVHARNLSVESASLVVSDIIHITNLLLEEAGYCFFIHKSVREYYAAACIAKQSIEIAHGTYTRLARNWGHWRYVLQFLEQLDPVRMALFLELPELKAILKEGPLTYLTQFQSISIVRTQNGQEQLRISGGSFYCTRDHQIVRGSIRPRFVTQGFRHWCPGIEYPQVEPGQAASVPRNAIDFPRLLEWLGNSLDSGYLICQQRLERCRGFGTSGTGAGN